MICWSCLCAWILTIGKRVEYLIYCFMRIIDCVFYALLLLLILLLLLVVVCVKLGFEHRR